MSSPAESLRTAWNTLSSIPGGRYLFNRFLGWFVPYSGSVYPEVEILEAGFSRVKMEDRRAVRNHLDSIHAIALMNLGELSTGLAMMLGLPGDARAILTGLSIEFERKSRGTITAECRCDPPKTSRKHEYELESVLTNEAGHVVARAKARWLVAPAKD
jgi:acyl-coenzyme A thioesterase PaaI-like protein